MYDLDILQIIRTLCIIWTLCRPSGYFSDHTDKLPSFLVLLGSSGSFLDHPGTVRIIRTLFRRPGSVRNFYISSRHFWDRPDILHTIWILLNQCECLRWWTSGVVNVWGGERLILQRGWWRSGVVNVWFYNGGGERLGWWMSGWWTSYNPDFGRSCMPNCWHKVNFYGTTENFGV